VDGHATETQREEARAAIGRKVADGLNEVRMLMLGGQILLGFQYHAAFAPRFATLPAAARLLDLIALALMLAAFGFLAAVPPFHHLVERGAATFRLHRFITLMIEWALWPFAACLGIDLLIVTQRALPIGIASLIALGGAALTLTAWRAVTALGRHHIHGEAQRGVVDMANWHDPGLVAPSGLADKISQLLTEGRLILPGAQALLGFQFLAVLSEAFERLPVTSRGAHIAALVAITIAVILLMSPACYHRIVAAGDPRPDVARYAVRAILAALVPLGLGLAADLYVVARLVLDSVPAALALAGAMIVGTGGLWFVWPLALRRARRRNAIV
jgi:hypothetical protein